MFYQIVMQKTLPLSVLGTLDYLWGIDGLVTKLLTQLPSRTKVLVLAQTRQRPNTQTEYNVKYDVNNRGNTEWRDSLLLAQLKLIARRRDPRKMMTFKEMIDEYYSKNEKLKKQNAAVDMRHRNTDAVYKTLYNNFVAKMKLQNKTLLKSGNEVSESGSYPNKASLNKRINMKRSFASIDITTGPDIWFWDSSLPLNLASIAECNALYDHDPTTVLLLPSVLKYSMRVMKYATLLHRIGTDPDKYLSKRKDYKGDTSSTDSHTKEKDHSLLKTPAHIPAAATETPNTGHISDEDYFYEFANAYISSRLNCLDDLHAGTATTEVEVTQLLNLLCNSDLQTTADSTLCCQ